MIGTYGLGVYGHSEGTYGLFALYVIVLLEGVSSVSGILESSAR